MAGPARGLGTGARPWSPVVSPRLQAYGATAFLHFGHTRAPSLRVIHTYPQPGHLSPSRFTITLMASILYACSERLSI